MGVEVFFVIISLKIGVLHKMTSSYFNNFALFVFHFRKFHPIFIL